MADCRVGDRLRGARLGRSYGVLIVDLRHWILPNGELAPEATLAPHVARVVEVATAVEGSGLSNMLCRRRRCSGLIGTMIEDGTIRWLCNTCDDGGLVSHWQRTRWDLARVEVGPEDEELAAYVPLSELRALRDVELPAVLRAVLAGAPAFGDRACVTMTEVEIVELLDALQSAPRRRLLDQARGRFDQVLAAEQVPRQARAH